MRLVLDEHVAEQVGGRSVEPVVKDEPIRQRGRVRVEVLLHHQDGRDHRDQDVQGEERRMERPVYRLVATPGTDCNPGGRTGMLPFDPLASTLHSRRYTLADS